MITPNQFHSDRISLQLDYELASRPKDFSQECRYFKLQKLTILRDIRTELESEIYDSERIQKLKDECAAITQIWACSAEENETLCNKAIQPYMKEEIVFAELLRICEKIADIERELWPRSEKYIEQEAQLTAALQRAATAEPVLLVREQGTNTVYRLPGCFFKTGPFTTLECLMRDIMVLCGKEESSLPTRPDIRQMSDGTYANGIVQLEQLGPEFFDALEQNHWQFSGILSREAVIRDTIISIFMGMFDAHCCNVKVNKDRLVMFDLSLSMTYTNLVIDFNGALKSPFRSCTMALREAYEPLSEDEKEEIRSSLQEYSTEEFYERLLDLLIRYNVKFELEGKKILKVNEMLDAFEERINSIHLALNSPNVKSLRDIVFFVFPLHKFFFSLTIIRYLLSAPCFFLDIMKKPMTPLERRNEIQAMCGNQVGFYRLEFLLRDLSRVTNGDYLQMYNLLENDASNATFDLLVDHSINVVLNILEPIPKKIYESCVDEKETFEAIADFLQNSLQYNPQKFVDNATIVSTLRRFSVQDVRS